MTTILQVTLLLALSVSTAWTQAPYDYDPDCRSGDNMAHRDRFSDNWRILIDTYDYPNLYHPFSFPAPVWKSVDFDSPSGYNPTDGWFQIIGGTCTWALNTDTYRSPQEQHNWLFSQFISYEGANEIYLDVTFRLSSCRDNPRCIHDYVDVFNFPTDGIVSDDQRMDRDNYAHMYRLQQPPTGTQVSISERFPRSDNEGFYMGFEDRGTAGQVQRVIVYYTVCPSRQNELVVYPEVGTPPVGGPDMTFLAECVPFSHGVTSLEVIAFSGNSTCRDVAEGGARCECDDGHEISGDRKSCSLCPVGTYRSAGTTSTCVTCPQNSNAEFEGASICICDPDFFRSPEDGPDAPCTRAPGPVDNLVVTQTDDSSVELEWNKPIKTGGRDDLYYQLTVQETNNGFTTVHETEIVSIADTIRYSISGLQSFTTYQITVVSHNGVSDQEDPALEQLRTERVLATTTEGVPGVPLVSPLCTVVVWSAPLEMAGAVVGYQARLRQSDDAVIDLDADANFFITEDADRDANVVVEMRAHNSQFYGPWSSPVPLDCAPAVSCPTTTPCVCDCAATTPLATTTAAPTTTPPPTTTAAPSTPAPTTSSPSPACKPPIFTLKGQEVKNGSLVPLLDIGTDDDALMMETELEECCRDQRMGECYYPDGTLVGIANDQQTFYRNRAREQFIRLNRRSGTAFGDHPTGLYRCELPDSCGTLTSLYVRIE